MMKRRHFLRSGSGLGAACVAAIGWPVTALAQAWPLDTVRLIVPFAAGGGTDRLARMMAQRMMEKTGKSFIIENKPGAGGNLGAAQVAKATDANTLLFTTAAIAVSPFLFGKPGYSLTKDLVPIVQISSSPLVLVVRAGSPLSSVADLKVLAASRSTGLNYGSPGVGTTSHLGGFVLAQQLNIQASHVAYRGAGPAINALLSSEVDFALMAAVAVIPFIKNQQLRALGIAGKRPLPDLASAPLLAKQMPSLEMDNWQGILASSRVDRAVALRMNVLFNEVLKLPEVRTAVYADGATPAGGPASQFQSLIASDGAKYGGVVLAAGIKPE